jgi:hypothetical protein
VTGQLAARPFRVKDLTRQIQVLATDRQVPMRRIQRAVANTVLGQMLPSAVIKGGTGLTFRVGEQASRFTSDFDVALGSSLDTFEEELTNRLHAGWGGFTGMAIRDRKHSPEGVPVHYVMQPFRVKLHYQRQPWLTVDLEIGHDELGCVEDPETLMPDDVLQLFAALGLLVPRPVRVLKLEHQIAQKVHAATYPGSERSHDLVDLQLLWGYGPDLVELGSIAERLFRFRQEHSWPPDVTVNAGWATTYEEAATALDVEQDVELAAEWLRERIHEVVAATA